MLKRNLALGSKSSVAMRVATLLIALACATGSGLVLAGAFAAPAQVGIYPLPGSRVAPPGTQIAFRGVSAEKLRAVRVVGSSSGVHSGSVRAHSDSRGASFLPDKPFQPGESVTVTNGVKAHGAINGTFRFTVARPASIEHSPMPSAPRASGDVQQFHTEPGLQPARRTG
jgi:hypothetical protein